jgi:hypothetical protein
MVGPGGRVAKLDAGLHVAAIFGLTQSGQDRLRASWPYLSLALGRRYQ